MEYILYGTNVSRKINEWIIKMKNKITAHQIFWYFIMFSIIGLILETVYGYITTGTIESRKGLIWGPFCPVYGIGAIMLIFMLNHLNQKNYFKLFFYGLLIGAGTEYVLSYTLEAIYGSRFWDYTYTNSDINGRICTIYSFFWGILSILLMKVIKPIIDKLIDRINTKIKTSVEIAILIFLIIDTLTTVWAISIYKTRAINTYYNEPTIYSDNSWIRNIEENYFTDEKMQKTFPNLRMQTREGNQVFVRELIK